MKKTIMSLLCLLCVFSIAACSNKDKEQLESSMNKINTSAEKVDAGKTLVVYYSATGNTKTVGNYIVKATNADVLELEPIEPYSSDDLDWTKENSRVVFEHDNPDERNIELVKNTVDNWESYDTVFIGYPIWWGVAAWPVDDFVKSNDFSDKAVIPFATSSSSSLGDSGTLLSEMAGTGNWIDGRRFSSSVSEDEVISWVNDLNL